jgi:hypothetical protein
MKFKFCLSTAITFLNHNQKILPTQWNILRYWSILAVFDERLAYGRDLKLVYVIVYMKLILICC